MINQVGPTLSGYYNAIVSTIMQLSVLSSKNQDLQNWGRKKYDRQRYRTEVCQEIVKIYIIPINVGPRINRGCF